jgi:hypothetical protein
MVIAVGAMRMVKMAVNKIVHVIPVRHRLVTAAWAMGVPEFMPAAGVIRSTGARVGSRYGYDMLVHMIAMRVMQVPVVKIVGMVFVANCQMPAIDTMLVIVVRVMSVAASCHGGSGACK